MAANSRIDGHVLKALQFENERDAAPGFHWKVVITYYAVLHWMNAACVAMHLGKFKGQPVPSSGTHEALKLLMRQVNVDATTTTTYKSLEDLSREARYDINRPDLTEQDVEKARRYADRLRAWCITRITDKGFQIPDLPVV